MSQRWWKSLDHQPDLLETQQFFIAVMATRLIPFIVKHYRCCCADDGALLDSTQQDVKSRSAMLLK